MRQEADMSITHEEIVQSCVGLLSKAKKRRLRGGKSERVFVTAYQIWVLLQKEGNSICQILESKYGKAVGRHGGVNVGPAQRIGVALERSDRIETRHLDMRRLKVLDPEKDIEPSESSCCIFRLR
jgi:hypothetical protein